MRSSACAMLCKIAQSKPFDHYLTGSLIFGNASSLSTSLSVNLTGGVSFIMIALLSRRLTCRFKCQLFQILDKSTDVAEISGRGIEIIYIAVPPSASVAGITVFLRMRSSPSRWTRGGAGGGYESAADGPITSKGRDDSTVVRAKRPLDLGTYLVMFHVVLCHRKRTNDS
ncbi:hypothetical protein F5Y10DRAFT_116805 [Nemania abortiva]|nr:hypothetical protein F5Y10DRAFT_116805 [Nemania abortiva]